MRELNNFKDIIEKYKPAIERWFDMPDWVRDWTVDLIKEDIEEVKSKLEERQNESNI